MRFADYRALHEPDEDTARLLACLDKCCEREGNLYAANGAVPTAQDALHFTEVNLLARPVQAILTWYAAADLMVRLYRKGLDYEPIVIAVGTMVALRKRNALPTPLEFADIIPAVKRFCVQANGTSYAEAMFPNASK